MAQGAILNPNAEINVPVDRGNGHFDGAAVVKLSG
jgi:hypothetical protein